MESPSSRAEWVEIPRRAMQQWRYISLRPRGRSGLKFDEVIDDKQRGAVSVLAGGVG